jgi:hypothetical protein
MTTNQVLRARPGESLTLEEMRRSLSSVFFAAAPHESGGDRFTSARRTVAGLEADALQ